MRSIYASVTNGAWKVGETVWAGAGGSNSVRLMKGSISQEYDFKRYLFLRPLAMAIHYSACSRIYTQPLRPPPNLEELRANVDINQPKEAYMHAFAVTASFTQSHATQLGPEWKRSAPPGQPHPP